MVKMDGVDAAHMDLQHQLEVHLQLPRIALVRTF